MERRRYLSNKISNTSEHKIDTFIDFYMGYIAYAKNFIKLLASENANKISDFEN